MSWMRRAGWAVGGIAATGLLLVGGLAGGVYWLLENPDQICRGIEYGLEWPEGSIQVDDFQVDWDGTFEIDNLVIDPPILRIPKVTAGQVTGSVPNPEHAIRFKVIELGDVVARDLKIHQRVQRPPDSRPPPPSTPILLVADSLVIENGSFYAAPDPPFKSVSVGGVEGRLGAVRWTPAVRLIEGVGGVTIEHMDIGTIGITDLKVPYLLLADGNLSLGSSTFYYGRTQGIAEGLISGLDGKAAVEINVRLEGSRVEHAVEDAMERASPVMGWLTAELTIFAGGELARGDSRFDGWVGLSDAYVFVGRDLKLIPKVLLDVAPWFKREGGGWLHVGDLHGEAVFGRGWVELERMERISKKHRILQAWGSLRDGMVDLTVRAVPKDEKIERKRNRGKSSTGMGVRVRGPIKSAHIKLAKKEDLIDAPEVLVID